MAFDPDAPAWVNTILIMFGTVLLSIGGIITAIVLGAKSKKDALQALIDQVQEERNKAVEAAEKDRALFSEKIDKFWADKHASRDYVGSLVDHIWQRKDPPPPPPPAGYIP